MKNNFLIRKYFIQFVSIIFFALSFFSCSSNKGQQTKTFLGTVCSINLFDDGSKKNYDAVPLEGNEAAEQGVIADYSGNPDDYTT